MKTSELKSLSKNELQNLLLERRDALSKFYFKVAKGKVKNIKEGKETKKDIARILTIL